VSCVKAGVGTIQRISETGTVTVRVVGTLGSVTRSVALALLCDVTLTVAVVSTVGENCWNVNPGYVIQHIPSCSKGSQLEASC